MCERQTITYSDHFDTEEAILVAKLPARMIKKDTGQFSLDWNSVNYLIDTVGFLALLTDRIDWKQRITSCFS